MCIYIYIYIYIYMKISAGALARHGEDGAADAAAPARSGEARGPQLASRHRPDGCLPDGYLVFFSQTVLGHV